MINRDPIGEKGPLNSPRPQISFSFYRLSLKVWKSHKFEWGFLQFLNKILNWYFRLNIEFSNLFRNVKAKKPLIKDDYLAAWMADGREGRSHFCKIGRSGLEVGPLRGPKLLVNFSSALRLMDTADGHTDRPSCSNLPFDV